MVRWILILCFFAGVVGTEAASASAGKIQFVQSGCCGIPEGFDSRVGFRSAESPGDLNVVIVGWCDSSTTLAPTAVTDDLGNSYAVAGRALVGTGVTQAIYYSVNIAGGRNHVYVHWNSTPNLPNVRILEYSGVDPINPLDGPGVGATGSQPDETTSLTTSVDDDLLVSGTISQSASSPGMEEIGWAQRIYANAVDVEDRPAVDVGTYPIPIPFPQAPWVTNAAAFKANSEPLEFDDYYVNGLIGSDSNSGKCAVAGEPAGCSGPWATIPHADAALTLGPNGTVVHVAAGNYDYSNTGVLKTSSSGTASARISFVSDTPRGAKIVNGSWQVDNNYADIVGFELSCPYCWSGINVGESNPPFTGGRNVRVLNNYVHDVGTMVNTPNGYGCPGGGGIYTSNESTPVLVDGNRINTIGSKHPCLETHGIYVAGPGVTVTNNVISNAVSWGIQFFRNVCHEVAANNTVFHNYQGGIIVSAGWTDGGICNNGNTPYDDYTAVNNNLAINNGMDGYGAHGIEEFGNGRIGSHNTYNNNLSIGNRPDDTVYIIGGGSASNNLSTGTPESIFVNYQDDGTGDYHLQAGSPAIDAGTAANCAVFPGLSPCEPTVDYDGTSRPQGAAFDIGAFEYMFQ